MKSVETILLENIDKPNSCFIFPTDVAASRWADHLLRIKGGTAAMNKFIAWDVFKRNSIRSRVQNKKSIPSALRKIFCCRLIRENADAVEQGKTPIFTSLIREQWAAQAGQFAPWLTQVLPQLGVWFQKTSGLTINCILADKPETVEGSLLEKAILRLKGDDRDLYTLAKRYAQFLEEYKLFEPAWETPPFNDEGKEVFIFFPEALSDYSEYRELLAASNHVKTISASGTDKMENSTFFYTNSRREITEAALYIRALHEKKGINWTSIAVCIPDSENYEPYVIREFTNRNIPFAKRISKPLANYMAGQFFRSVVDCVSQNYSFSSLVSLIMNRNLPWKDTEQINNLITFGIKNNCLYSWTEKINGKEQNINVWEDAFTKPLGGIDTETRIFFERLKDRLQSLRSAVSFSEIRRNYFNFRGLFFDMEKCSHDSDLVLSRCISELTALVELEKDFPNVPATDPFLFFTEHLTEVPYLARQETDGVAILPYKTAAAAPFDCHVILGAGQENISLVYSRLAFLPKKKREELKVFDEDVSAAFIELHKFTSVKNAAFFCSEKTFSGFSIPHSKTGSTGEPMERYASEQDEKFSPDYFSLEKDFCSSAENSGLEKLHENQINGFTEWKKRRGKNAVSSKKWNTGKKVRELISSIYAKNGKYSVSASSLQPYFQCSLKWLFERVFALENVQIETSLMAENIAGTVYHDILNLFFKELKENKEYLLTSDNSSKGLVLPEPYRKLLERCVDKVFDNFPMLQSSSRFQMSALTERLLYAGKKDFRYHLEKSLVQFLSFFAGCRVIGTEISYQIERDSFILNGITDCILKDEKNNYIIIDFKLKWLPERQDCTGEGEKGLSNFQLPMYITLAEENEKIKIDTALFYSILESKAEVLFGVIQDIHNEKELPKKEEDRIFRESELYNGIFEEFNKKTVKFSQEVSTGNFSVFETKSNNCLECGYNRICRTAYIINRETAAMAQTSPPEKH